MGKKKKQKDPTTRIIMAKCALCKGEGSIPKPLPFLANPRAPSTRTDKLGLQTCPECKGTGKVTTE
jgi:hypothetical protein